MIIQSSANFAFYTLIPNDQSASNLTQLMNLSPQQVFSNLQQNRQKAIPSRPQTAHQSTKILVINLMHYNMIILAQISRLIIYTIDQLNMAKKSTMLFRLLSSAGTGYFYIGKKNTRDNLKKLTAIKYDPLVNRHVLFNEVKMPSGKKRT